MSNETEVFQDELNAEVSLAVQTKLADANITEAHLANLKAELLPLAEEPITDDARAALVKGALRKVSNTKGIIERICKVGRRPALLAQRAWIAAENELTAVTEEIQKPLKARMDEWEAIAAAKQAEEVARWTAKINARKERMATVGFRFNPLTKEYELPGFASINEDGVIGLNVDDLQFAEWLLDLERQVTEHRERQEEEERTRRIAAEALAEKQRVEADRIAAAQAELERKQREMEAREAQMNARVNEARKNELIAAGMTLDDPDDSLPFGPALVLVDMCLPVHNLHSMTDEQYAEAIAEAKRQAAELEEYNKQKAEVERLQREQQEKERLAREEAMKAEAAEEALRQERQRVAAEQERQEKEKERLAQQEAEERAQRGDVEKVMDFLAHTQMLIERVPELKSAIGQSAMRSYTKQLMDIHASMVKLSKEL